MSQMQQDIQGQKDYYMYLKLRSPEPTRKEMTLRKEFGKIYELKYEIEVKDYSFLHIGSGLVKITNDKDQPVGLDFMRNSKGEPIIPGSTLKGYFRSNYEALVIGSCFISNSNRYKYYSCTGDNFKLCPTCDLFGVNKIMSRVIFSDATLVSDFTEILLKIPKLMGPKDNLYRPGFKKVYKDIIYDPNHKKNLQKDYIWGINPGARFQGKITLYNSDLSEVRKLIHSGFNMYKDLTLVLGHGKNLGLGKCQLKNLTIFVRNSILDSLKQHIVDMTKYTEDGILNRNRVSQTEFRWELLDKIHQTKGKPYPEDINFR